MDVWFEVVIEPGKLACPSLVMTGVTGAHAQPRRPRSRRLRAYPLPGRDQAALREINHSTQPLNVVGFRQKDSCLKPNAMDCSLLATPGPDSNDVNFTQGKFPGNDIHKLNSQGEYLSSPNSSIVVFIDTGVIDYQRLQAGALPGISTVILSPAEDAMAEMTAYLQQNPQVTTVHIVSHGVPGRLYLGTSQIDLENICDYENLLKLWPVNIHILLYGCQVAAGDAGEEFIEKLHQLTGATVIASATHTGSIRLGGNWKLEAIVSRTGNQQDLNTPLAFCENTLATYAGVFAPLDDEPPPGIRHRHHQRQRG